MNRRSFLKGVVAVAAISVVPISIAGAALDVLPGWRFQGSQYQPTRVSYMVYFRRPCELRGYEEACWMEFDRDFYKGKHKRELIALAEETYPREEV